MNKFSIPAAAAAIALALSAGAAHASTITIYSGADDGSSDTGPWVNSTAAEAAFIGAAGGAGAVRTATFEDVPVGYQTNFDALPDMNVTLTGPNDGPAFSGVSTTVAGGVYAFNTTAGGSHWLGFPSGTATFAFASGVNAFGFYLTGVQETFTSRISVSFDDGSAQILVAPINSSGGAAYFGFTDSQSFSSITIANYSSDAWGVDNVSFSSAIPEPASVLLMLAGLAGVAGVARRRRA